MRLNSLFHFQSISFLFSFFNRHLNFNIHIYIYIHTCIIRTYLGNRRSDNKKACPWLDIRIWMSVSMDQFFDGYPIRDWIACTARSSQISANLIFYPTWGNLFLYRETTQSSRVHYIRSKRIREGEIESHSGVIVDIVVSIVFSMFAYPIPPFCPVLANVARFYPTFIERM